MAYDEDLVNRIRELLAEEVGVIEQRMFGGLAFLIGGHMSVSRQRAGRAPGALRGGRNGGSAEKPHAGPMIMRGKALNGWVFVAAEGVGTKRALKPWVERGVPERSVETCQRALASAG